MSSTLRLAVGLCLLLAPPLASLVRAQEAATQQAIQTPQRYQAVDRAAAAAMEKQQVVGMCVAVIEDGQIAWMKGYGLADREAGIAADPKTTQFRWASISKSVTAVAAMQLVEQGRLDLDADVRSYVPEFPGKGVVITPGQLLCHKGGIVHYSNGPVIQTKRDYDQPHPFDDVIVALDRFKESPLVNQPGDKYAYSTHGYILLSAVLQRAGGKPFAEQVQERIAGPLGMTSFQPDRAWVEIPNRTAGYRRSEAQEILRRPDPEVPDVSWKLAGGGFTSTTQDLARFAAGLLRKELVSEESRKQLWSVQAEREAPGGVPYGYGFFILQRPSGETWVGHDGRQEKARTAMLLIPDRKCGVVVMTNSEWVDVMDVAGGLLIALQEQAD